MLAIPVVYGAAVVHVGSSPHVTVDTQLRKRVGVAVRIAVIAAAMALGAWGVARDAEGFVGAVTQVGAARVAVALAFVVAGLLASAETWRGSVHTVAGPIDHRAARRLFFVTQLGKYLPGSVWTVLGQVDAARRHGLARSRMAIGALLFLVVHLLTGIVVAALLLGTVSGELVTRYWWAFAVGMAAAIGLLPPVLTRMVDLGLKLLKREPLGTPLDGRQVLVPLFWMFPTWAAFGLAAAAVTAPLTDAPPLRVVITVTGAFALSWSVGMLVVPAPAGLGAREAVLVLALTPLVGVTGSTSVAIILRVVHTVGDLLLGVAAFRTRQVVSSQPE